MRRILSRLITIFFLLSVIGMFSSPKTLAFNIFTQQDQNGNSAVDCSSGSPASKSAVCAEQGNNTNPLTGPNGVFIGITNIVAIVAGIAAVLLLILGGIRYITSTGDSAKVTSAKNTIVYALVGIAVIVLARTLIIFVISKIQ